MPSRGVSVMARSIPFTKMEGCGNDYVYVNGLDVSVPDPARLARAVSDRHFGIGSDGLVLILPSERADVRMRMFNSDGSEAEMCGNASRCVGKYAYDHGLVRQPDLRLETGAGIKNLRLCMDGCTVTGARVDMGEPELRADRVPVLGGDGQRCVDFPLTVAGTAWHMTCVSMGNPHAVLFVDNVHALNLPERGPQFEHHPCFPRRTNTGFAQIVDRGHVRMRVWERGAGETLACGTGACATAVACVLNGLTDRRVRVELLGGSLDIEWNAADGHVYMSGPARTVFSGVYNFAD